LSRNIALGPIRLAGRRAFVYFAWRSCRLKAQRRDVRAQRSLHQTFFVRLKSPLSSLTYRKGVSCVLWVISGHREVSLQCPLHPRKRTSEARSAMSALGQKTDSQPKSTPVGRPGRRANISPDRFVQVLSSRCLRRRLRLTRNLCGDAANSTNGNWLWDGRSCVATGRDLSQSRKAARDHVRCKENPATGR
jgi:hypothetical protein